MFFCESKVTVSGRRVRLLKRTEKDGDYQKIYIRLIN